jgi:uncharacterized cupin superfamily protein
MPKEPADMTDASALRPIRIDPAVIALHPLELDPDDFQSPLPLQHYGLVFEDAEIGLAVGIWDTTTMQEAFGPYPGDEFITVLDGGFAMVDAVDAPLAAAKAGDSVTFRNGTPSSWKQDGYLRKVYLTLQDPDRAAAAIPPSADGFRVIGPGHRPHGAAGADGVTLETIFRNDAGTLTVTLGSFPAQSVPGKPSPTHRLIRVLQGAITLTGTAASPDVFGPGAHVFLPKGNKCAWSVAEGTVAVMVDVTAR